MRTITLLCWAAVLSLLTVAAACSSVSERTSAAIAGTDTFVFFEIWPTGLTGFDAKIRVKNPRGEAIATLWQDIDLEGRPNLYRLPNDRIAILTGLGGALFAIPPKGTPRLLTTRELPPTETSRRWTYLGAIVRLRGDGRRFVPARDLPECIDLYGEGSTRYRSEYAVGHFCPPPTKLESQSVTARP